MVFAWPKILTMKIPPAAMMPNALAHKFVTSVSVKSLKVPGAAMQAMGLLTVPQMAARRAVEAVRITDLVRGMEVCPTAPVARRHRNAAQAFVWAVLLKPLECVQKGVQFTKIVIRRGE